MPNMQEGESQTTSSITGKNEASEATSKTLSLGSSFKSIPIRREEFPSIAAVAGNTPRTETSHPSPNWPAGRNDSTEHEESTSIAHKPSNLTKFNPDDHEGEDAANGLPSGTQYRQTYHESGRADITDNGGYTLEHGPWEYKIHSKKTSGHYSPIANEDDYEKMLDILKSVAEESTGSTRSLVVMMHVCTSCLVVPLRKQVDSLTGIGHGPSRNEGLP